MLRCDAKTLTWEYTCLFKKYFEMFRGQRLWLSWQSSSLRYHRYRSSNPANDKINYRTCTYILLKRRNQRKRCRAGPKTNIKGMKIVSKQTSAGKDEMRNPRMCFASKCWWQPVRWFHGFSRSTTIVGFDPKKWI